jgi:hypothetical protein
MYELADMVSPDMSHILDLPASTCVLPITTYGSKLWLYEGAAMKGPLNSLCKMQRHACLWITSAC